MKSPLKLQYLLRFTAVVMFYGRLLLKIFRGGWTEMTLHGVIGQNQGGPSILFIGRMEDGESVANSWTLAGRWCQWQVHHAETSWLKVMLARPRSDLQKFDVIISDCQVPATKQDWTQGRYSPFLRARLTLESSIDEQIAAIPSRTQRRKMRKVLSHRDLVRVTQSQKDLDYFYRVLFVPYIKDRFGEQAYIEKKSVFERYLAQRGRLVFIEEKHKPVCGAIVFSSFKNPECLTFWKSAYRRQDQGGVTRDRASELEAAVIEYAIDLGYSVLDMGATVPFEKNGIWLRKKRLGCGFYLDPQCELNIYFRATVANTLASTFGLQYEDDGVVGSLASGGQLAAKNDDNEQTA